MPAPANDNFASATALSTTLPGSLASQKTDEATDETGEPLETNYFVPVDKQSVWYTFTPTSTGRYRISLRSIVDVGTLDGAVAISVYTGSAVNALTEVRTAYCDLAFTPGATDFGIHLQLTNGVTYRIAVWSPIASGESADDHTVTFDMEWDAVTFPAAPANDDLDSPRDLGDDPADQTLTDTTLKGSTVEAFEIADQYLDGSVWFRIETAENHENAEITVHGDGSPDYFPYLELYQGLAEPPVDFDDLNFLLWAGDGVTDDATIISDLGPSNVWYVRVTEINYGSDAQGDFDFEIAGAYSPPPGPPNDDFASVENANNIFDTSVPFMLNKSVYSNFPVPKHAGAIDGTTVDGTAEALEPAHGGFTATRSMWYILRAPSLGGNFKFWVESAVDCVLSMYNYDPVVANLSALVSVAEDDDSGTGNWPEINQVLTANQYYWICVDSKTAGTFELKWQRQTTGAPPANDNWVNAEDITGTLQAVGSTVGGTGEPYEYESDYQNIGPTDGVWYKITAPSNGRMRIRGICTSNNDDQYVFAHAFAGASLETLVNVGRDDIEWLLGDTLDEGDPLMIEATAGVDYYIRLATWSGGSEDFEIYIDYEVVLLDLQASGWEVGPFTDEAEVYFNLQASGVEEMHGVLLDDATVLLDLTAGGAEIQAHDYADTATVYFNLVAGGHECYSTFSPSLLGDGEADLRFYSTTDVLRLNGDPNLRWSEGEVLIEGINC